MTASPVIAAFLYMNYRSLLRLTLQRCPGWCQCSLGWRNTLTLRQPLWIVMSGRTPDVPRPPSGRVARFGAEQGRCWCVIRSRGPLRLLMEDEPRAMLAILAGDLTAVEAERRHDVPAPAAAKRSDHLSSPASPRFLNPTSMLYERQHRCRSRGSRHWPLSRTHLPTTGPPA